MRARQCADTNTIIVLGFMLEICASVQEHFQQSTPGFRLFSILTSGSSTLRFFDTAWIDRCSGHLTASDGSKQLLWQWEKEKDKKGPAWFWQDSYWCGAMRRSLTSWSLTSRGTSKSEHRTRRTKRIRRKRKIRRTRNPRSCSASKPSACSVICNMHEDATHLVSNYSTQDENRWMMMKEFVCPNGTGL